MIAITRARTASNSPSKPTMFSFPASYYPAYLPVLALSALGLVAWYWTRTRRSISYLRGPPAESWLVGNLGHIQRAENAADPDFKWTKEYGTAFRLTGCFGEEVLFVSDPKALQYILNKSGYNFPKSWEMLVRIHLTTGRGIVAAEGAQHARHRRVMNPSFSHSALKGFLSLFFNLSRKTTTAWKAKIRKHHAETAVINVSELLARTTLDAIGEAAFGFKFNAIEEIEPQTEFQKAYQNLFVETLYMVSDFTIVFKRLLGYAPLWLSNLLTSLPKKDLKRLKKYMAVARDVARTVVAKQMHADATGKEGGKDVMSILVKANTAEDPKRRLEEDEILSQITTFMLAGHETTANTLSWLFYELSKNPEAQRKVREEVRATWEAIADRGGSEMTISDLETMQYTTAVMKETLRYHPILMQLSRRAGHDDIIPLEMSSRTVAGETITAIPIRKGQVVQVGLAAYNRLKEVWGEDADEWRPERFIEGITKEQKTSLGVHANLSTFSSGLRGCIGWRFSLLEMQAVLVELIDHFEFNPAPGVEIKRAHTGLMQSMVKGQESKGAQMPLRVSIIS